MEIGEKGMKMKTVQMTLDENLIKAVDKTVKKLGDAFRDIVYS